MSRSLPINTDVRTIDDARRSIGQIVAYLERLAATSGGNGASLIGIEDGNGKFNATNIEAALYELADCINDGGTMPHAV